MGHGWLTIPNPGHWWKRVQQKTINVSTGKRKRSQVQVRPLPLSASDRQKNNNNYNRELRSRLFVHCEVKSPASLSERLDQSSPGYISTYLYNSLHNESLELPSSLCMSPFCDRPPSRSARLTKCLPCRLVWRCPVAWEHPSLTKVLDPSCEPNLLLFLLFLCSCDVTPHCPAPSRHPSGAVPLHGFSHFGVTSWTKTQNPPLARGCSSSTRIREICVALNL